MNISGNAYRGDFPPFRSYIWGILSSSAFFLTNYSQFELVDPNSPLQKTSILIGLVQDLFVQVRGRELQGSRNHLWSLQIMSYKWLVAVVDMYHELVHLVANGGFIFHTGVGFVAPCC